MKKTSDYRREMLREMTALRTGQSTVNKAKAVAQLGNAITQSIIAEAQVLRLSSNGQDMSKFGELEIVSKGDA